MPLTTHSGMGLFCQAMHADPLLYKAIFSYPKLILKKSPTLLCQELHSSFTNIPYFPPKQNALLARVIIRWYCCLIVIGHFRASVCVCVCVCVCERWYLHVHSRMIQVMNVFLLGNTLSVYHCYGYGIKKLAVAHHQFPSYPKICYSSGGSVCSLMSAGSTKKEL